MPTITILVRRPRGIPGRGCRYTVSFAIIFCPSAVLSRYLDAEEAVFFTLRAELSTIPSGPRRVRIYVGGQDVDDLERVNLSLRTVFHALAQLSVRF
jgi:hypothetical protein